MNTQQFLDTLKAYGVQVQLVGDSLRVAGRDALPDDLATELQERAAELAVYLKTQDADIAWRAAAILGRLRDVGQGEPIPLLVALPDAAPKCRMIVIPAASYWSQASRLPAVGVRGLKR